MKAETTANLFIGAVMLLLVFGLTMGGIFLATRAATPPQPGECKTYVKKSAERRGDTLFYFPDTTFWCVK